MKRFQILSLSGGGYLGLYTASILKGLEEKFGSPIGRHFDLICGTSIGGIIALGLAFDKSAAKIAQAFEDDGEKIFNFWPHKLVSQWFWPKYSDTALRSTITRILGPDKQLGDALHPVIVPAVNLTKGAAQIFKTPHHEKLVLDWKQNPVDIGLATSAAPSIFPLAEINDVLYADGGLFANAPDLLGIHEALNFMRAEDYNEIHMLSIGTTTRSFSLGHSSGKQLGRIGWVRNNRLLRLSMSSQQRLVEDMVGHLLKDRYFRIDSDQSEEQSGELALDCASKMATKTLRGLATNTLQRTINQPQLEEFFKHNASVHKFYHGNRAK